MFRSPSGNLAPRKQIAERECASFVYLHCQGLVCVCEPVFSAGVVSLYEVRFALSTDAPCANMCFWVLLAAFALHMGWHFLTVPTRTPSGLPAVKQILLMLQPCNPVKSNNPPGKCNIWAHCSHLQKGMLLMSVSTEAEASIIILTTTATSL